MGEKKPEEGDYCRRNFEIIYKLSNGKTICDTCDVRCPHSAKKEETDYLVKKRKEV